MPTKKFEIKLKNVGVTNDSLVKEIKLLARKLKKKTLTKAEFDAHSKYGSHLVVRKIGWNKAKEKAGLQIDKPMNTTTEQLLKNLFQVWLNIGRQPGRDDMKRPISIYSHRPYVDRFGSWTDALVAFGKSIKKNKLDYEKIKMIEAKQPFKHKTPRTISAELRMKVLSRDKFTCPYCPKSDHGKPGKVYVIDHIFPWAKGGETTLDNLQVMCRSHNLSKSAFILNPRVKKKKS